MHHAVIGGGSWGTALASVLAESAPVRLWARSAEVVHGIQEHHRNPKYVSDFELSTQIQASQDIEWVLKGARIVMLVVPSHALRNTLPTLVEYLSPNAIIVNASKGIEIDSLMTMEEVMNDVLPRQLRSEVAFLSGPSFAKETLAKQATAVTVASRFIDVAQEVQHLMNTAYFRIYTTDDVIGVELGGALKNVIAIASGVADGLGLGHNSRAALITRGVAEITRLAVKRGANPLTLSGLSGMGDLILTCTGGLSRNRSVGVQLGQGKTLDLILHQMNEVAEGVKTSKSAYLLSKREEVDMPITHEVYQMLYENKAPKRVLHDLMGRRMKRERDQ
jgi:glycerol-3-phosphate dehydrogenase (NAD(P)+)